jgi:hypothetical protein
MGSALEPDRETILINEDTFRDKSFPKYRTFEAMIPIALCLRLPEYTWNSDIFSRLRDPSEQPVSPKNGIVIRSIELVVAHNPAPSEVSFKITIPCLKFGDLDAMQTYLDDIVLPASREGSANRSLWAPPSLSSVLPKLEASDAPPVGSGKYKKKKSVDRGAEETEDDRASRRAVESADDEFSSVGYKLKLTANSYVDSKSTVHRVQNSQGPAQAETHYVHRYAKYMEGYANFDISKFAPSGTALPWTVGDDSDTSVTTTTPTTTQIARSGCASAPPKYEFHVVGSLMIEWIRILHANEKFQADLRTQGKLEELGLRYFPVQKPRAPTSASALLPPSSPLDSSPSLQRRGLERPEEMIAHAETIATLASELPSAGLDYLVRVHRDHCELVRRKIRSISSTIRFADLKRIAVDISVPSKKDVNTLTGKEYLIPITLKIRYLYVPFDRDQSPFFS